MPGGFCREKIQYGLEGITSILFKAQVQITGQNRGNDLESTHAKRRAHQSCERAASSVMNHTIHFSFS